LASKVKGLPPQIITICHISPLPIYNPKMFVGFYASSQIRILVLAGS
jgi:hypothetical protein